MEEAITAEAFLTFFHHSDCQALLKATKLAPVPPPFVHRTVFIHKADILGIFLHCTLKEIQTQAFSIPHDQHGEGIHKINQVLKMSAFYNKDTLMWYFEQ